MVMMNENRDGTQGTNGRVAHGGAGDIAGGAERRGSERITLIKPAKIFDRRADKYFPARTTNISEGGVLLTVNRSMPIHTGDELAVGLSKEEFPAVLAERDFRAARVVRVIPIDQHAQAVALAFIRPDEGQQPTPRVHITAAGRGSANRERVAA